MKRFAFLGLLVALAACGGGGNSVTPPPLIAPAAPFFPPNAINVTPNDQHMLGSAAHGFQIIGNQPVAFSVFATDTFSRPLLGAAAPITVKSSDPAITVTPVIGSPNAFTLQVNAFRATPVTLTLSSSGGLTAKTTVSLTTIQELWVANVEIATIIGYPVMPGATPTAMDAISDPNLQFTQGLAFDAHGNLWAANRNGNTVTEYTPPFFGTKVPVVIIPSNGPTSLAFDASGNLWVTTSPPTSGFAGGTLTEYTAPLTSSSTPSLTISNGLFFPEDVAFDASGNIWVATLTAGNQDSDFVKYTPPFAASSAPSTTIAVGTGGEAFGLAFDPAGNLWTVGGQTPGGGSLVEYAAPLTSSSTPSATITAGIDVPFSPRFDANGNLWLSNAFGSTVTAYNPATHAQITADTIPNPGFPVGLTFAP